MGKLVSKDKCWSSVSIMTFKSSPTTMSPSIAQLVERWTVVVTLSVIHRSLVQIRLEGIFVQLCDKTILSPNRHIKAQISCFVIVQLHFLMV